MARPDFDKIWASSRVSIPTIGGTDYASGWLTYLGATPPSTDDHDYVMNLQDERAVWLQDQALLSVGHEWQEDVSYDDNAYVRAEGGGALYKSIVSPNTGNGPTASPSQWRLVPDLSVLGQGSLTTNGWKPLGGGLILQWGNIGGSLSTTVTTSTVTLPIAFPNAALAINGTRLIELNTANTPAIGEFFSVGTTTAAVTHVRESGSIGGITWQYMALGY